MDRSRSNDPYFDWPLDEGERGREVWYSLVTHQDGDRAFWYRYTLLSTDSGHQEGRVWAGYTDREQPERSFFTTERHPLDAVGLSTPFEYEVDGCRLTSTSASGELDDGTRWDFEYEEDDFTFTPLRSKKLTDAAERLLGSGRHWSYNQSISIDGELQVGGETVEFDSAPGHQGHTVGR
ncbi:MAG: hypothetical protein ACOCT0_03145, partial [Halobacteriota archaeon]